MTIPSVPIFGLEWHIRQSPAQQLLVADPLRPYVRFEPIAWGGEALPALTAAQRRSPVRVFFQLPPPPELAADPALRVVWIPMWDEARGYEEDWWRRLPKSLRVVAFSREVGRRAKAAGLETLAVRYFPPDDLPPADWSGGRVLFYWNRSGLVGMDFLDRFCRALAVDRLIVFRTAQDRVPAALDFSPGDRIGNTRVEVRTAEGLIPRGEYADVAGRANIFLAPRDLRGRGADLPRSAGARLRRVRLRRADDERVHRPRGERVSAAAPRPQPVEPRGRGARTAAGLRPAASRFRPAGLGRAAAARPAAAGG